MVGIKIDFDINTLTLEVRNNETLKYGELLYEKKAITNLSFFTENLSFRGTVNDRGAYNSVVVRINLNGEIKQYRCSCSEYNRYGNACSHIVSVTRLLSDYQREINDRIDSTDKVVPLFSNGALLSNSYLLQNIDNGTENLSGIVAQNSRESEPASIIDFAQLKNGKLDLTTIRLNSNVDELFTKISKISAPVNSAAVAGIINVKLIPTYYFSRNYNGASHWIELVTGTNKLYVVKNIIEYINAIYFHEKLHFGKNFTYDPKSMEFDEISQKLVDIIVMACEDKKQLKQLKYNYFSPNENRKFELPNSSLIEFLGTMQKYGQEFNMSINFGQVIKVKIISGNPPISMKLEKIQGGLKLEFGFYKYAFEKLDYEGRFVLYDSELYGLTPENGKIMSAFIEFLKDSKEDYILIPDSDASRFHSNVLPLLEKIASITIDKSIETLVLKEEIETRIYFDRIINGRIDGITAKVEFIYGETEINPLLPHSGTTKDGKIVIRNSEIEKNIIDILKIAGFEAYGGIFRLFDEEKIYEFLYDKLPTLGDTLEIYYSDDFKSLKLQGKYHISAGIKLSNDGELLDFSITHEGIDERELGLLLNAYRLKKKYYKLKNGAFLPLDNSQAASLARIVDSLGISDDELKMKTIHLPKFRAMYLDSLAREHPNFQIERNTHFKNLVQSITEPQDMEYEVPESLKPTLRDYQKTGFKWLNAISDYGFGGILADDMGLGKTLQVLTFLQYRKTENLKRNGKDEKYNDRPSIVIAPTSLVYNWLEEVDKFTVGITAKAISGSAAERQAQIKETEGVDLIITSYGMLKRDIELYEEMKFAYCFLDEAQHIKNPGTLNAQTVKRINALNYFALTGTPIENSLTELWSVFDYLMPGYLFTHGKFSKIYESPIVKKQDAKALKELGRHIRPFILRRMKRDVLLELPEKTESRMTCTLEAAQRKVYMAYMLEAKKSFETEISTKGFENSQIKILAMLTRLRQICCHPSTFIENYEGGSGKTELFFELVEEALEGGHRVLAFSQFTSMLGIIRKELDVRKIGYFYLDGETAAKDRMEMVNAFNKGKNEIFLISLKAGGTGLNLVGADTVIHLDPWWNPAVEDQATDRAYRIGQKNPVSVYKLVTKGTIEEKIFALQKKKKELIDSVIEPGESFLTKMTVDEVRGLFELDN